MCEKIILCEIINKRRRFSSNRCATIAYILFLLLFDSVIVFARTEYFFKKLFYSFMVLLCLTHKVSFETTWWIVPFKTFAVAIPQFQAIFFFAIFVAEIIWFSSVPVDKCDWFASCHPEEASFFSQIRTRRPEMFIAKTYWKSNWKINYLILLLFLILLTKALTKRCSEITKATYRSHVYVFLIDHSLLAMRYWPDACRGIGNIVMLYTNLPRKPTKIFKKYI